MSKNKIAIVVISCDKYQDLWENCASMFNTFWPDCPYDKFLISNLIPYKDQGFRPILVGDDFSWSLGLKTALNRLESEYDYVFTMLEDYYFIDPIDNNYMVSMFNSFVEIDGNFLRLLKVLNPKIEYFNKYFGLTENFTPYRQTVVFTLWKIKTLNEILKDDENAWEFEKVGVKRGFHYDKFFCVYKNKFNVINLVIKGKIVPSSYSKLRKIFPNFVSGRPSFTYSEMFSMRIRDFMIISFLKYIPPKLRSKIYFFVNK